MIKLDYRNNDWLKYAQENNVQFENNGTSMLEGDIDLDGEVTSADALMILQMVVGLR